VAILKEFKHPLTFIKVMTIHQRALILLLVIFNVIFIISGNFNAWAHRHIFKLLLNVYVIYALIVIKGESNIDLFNDHIFCKIWYSISLLT